MSAITTVTIDGVQYNANFEYTHQDVAQQFRDSLQVFVEVFNLTDIKDEDGNVTSTVAEQINSTTTSRAQQAIQDFTNLARNGLIANDPNSPTKQYYLSLEMARDLDLLMSTLKATGATSPGSINEQQLETWRALAAQTPSIQNIMQSLIDTSGVANRSLQALTELVYITTGNEVMADSLESLEEALGSTKDVIDTLTDLQNLHNRLGVESKDTFSAFAEAFNGYVFDNHLGDSNKTSKAYQSAGSAYFGQPINPTLEDGMITSTQRTSTNASAFFAVLSSFLLKPSSSFFDAANELIRLRERIRTQIADLSALTPQEFDASGNPIEDPGTLVSRLKKVLKDINANFVAPVQIRTTTIGSGSTAVTKPVMSNALMTYELLATSNQSTMQGIISGFRLWMVDNYDKRLVSGADPSKAGIFQRNITFAITASESMNDTQKEKVRRFLFIFEEYYKSASAILTKITQLIEKMAQAMAR